MRLIGEGRRVFVASTLDLHEERLAAQEELVELGLVPVLIDTMEGAYSVIGTHCEDTARGSDCILILSDNKNGHMTIREIEAALGAHLPMITLARTRPEAMNAEVSILWNLLDEVSLLFDYVSLEHLRLRLRYIFGNGHSENGIAYLSGFLRPQGNPRPWGLV